MFPELLILGLLCVGGLVFFRRVVLPGSRWASIGVASYDFVDVLFVGLLAFIYLPDQLLVMLGRLHPGAYTRELIIQSNLMTLALIIFVLGVLVGRRMNPLDLFGLRGQSPRRILLGAATCLLALLPVVFFAMMLTQYCFGRPAEQPLMIYLRTHSGWADLLPLIVTAVIIAPFTEEIIFRGYVYGVVRRYGGRWCGILFSAVFFAAIHGHIPSLIPLFLLAVGLNLAYEYTGSLWTTMLMHGTFNSISIVAALWWPELGS